jgi:hypothetical protein
LFLKRMGGVVFYLGGNKMGWTRRGWNEVGRKCDGKDEMVILRERVTHILVP